MRKIACRCATACLLAVAICGSPATGGDGVSPFYRETLAGRWTGEKDGTKVVVSFKGDEVHWTVVQQAGKVKETISAGPMECVFVSKAGWVDFLLPVAERNSKGEKTGKTESLQVGRLYRGPDNAICLKIYPVQRYRPVEGLVLHFVPPAKAGKQARQK